MTSKDHFNVGTIGHVDHGKTTLTAAISAVQAIRVGGKATSYDEIAKASAAQGRRDENKIVTIATSHIEYESDARHYAHVDCPGHSDFIKNMIVGAAQMDAAIMLLDATAGPQQQTREHALLARQVGIQHIVAFINKVDIADEELVELVEMEGIEMLESQGFYDVPFIRGSAMQALKATKQDVILGDVQPIVDLVAALDALPMPVRDVDGPFLMPVENTANIKGRGVVATGRVSRGRLKKGEKVEIVGLTEGREVVVTGIQMFWKDMEAAEAGQNVGLLLRGVEKGEIDRGMVLTRPGTVDPHSEGQAELFVLKKEEGGRHTPFGVGYSPQFFFGTTDVTGKIAAIEGAELILPGDRATVLFELGKKVGIEPGMTFAVREGGKTVGAGRVTKVT